MSADDVVSIVLCPSSLHSFPPLYPGWSQGRWRLSWRLSARNFEHKIISVCTVVAARIAPSSILFFPSVHGAWRDRPARQTVIYLFPPSFSSLGVDTYNLLLQVVWLLLISAGRSQVVASYLERRWAPPSELNPQTRKDMVQNNAVAQLPAWVCCLVISSFFCSEEKERKQNWNFFWLLSWSAGKKISK